MNAVTPPSRPLTLRITHHGLRSRLGSSRKDKRHHVVDPVVVMAPWLIGGGVAVALARRLARSKGER